MDNNSLEVFKKTFRPVYYTKSGEGFTFIYTYFHIWKFGSQPCFKRSLN